MPITRKPPNPIGEWADQAPSVLDSPGEGMLRSLTKFVMPDETGEITGLVNPLISIFKSKLAREAATAGFRKNVDSMGIPNLRLAGEAFADRYPRVAAHINPRIGVP